MNITQGPWYRRNRLQMTLAGALAWGLAGLLLHPAPARAVDAVAAMQTLSVETGTQKLLRESGGVSRVAVGDPTIADVNVINARDVLVSGKKQGITSLMVWPRNGIRPTEYRVRVVAVKDLEKVAKVDPEFSQATIERGTSVAGKLPNLLAYRRARQAALPAAEGAVSDESVVEGEFQVLTTIKIAEVNKTTLKQFGAGLTYGRTGQDGNINFNSPTAPTSVLANAFNLIFSPHDIGNNETIGGILSILESKGLVRVLAEPSLTVTSGQTASFLAGGEFPVPVSQGGQGASISVEYKEFGVRLSLTPTVLAANRIGLKVAPEVSDLDFSAGIQVGGVSVPALTVRRTQTAVELGDGETFVISGLVSNNLSANVDKVPWLGDIPILGAFFRSVRNERKEKELIMVVTPHLVRPLARTAALPPLPGQKYDDYRPGFGHLIFGEKGDFEMTESGFSK
ncbi:MAG: type II and III secretion system protein family protein [Panacagrimonas sp.]